MGYFPIDQVNIPMRRSHVSEGLCNTGSPQSGFGIVVQLTHQILWSLPSFDKFNAAPSAAINDARPP
jgi:hypothetical protein